MDYTKLQSMMGQGWYPVRASIVLVKTGC